MDAYRVRAATLDDADALIAHRIAMFTDMDVPMDAAAVAARFREWLGGAMPSQVYRAWVVETGAGLIVAGAGITVVPWPPGPTYTGGRLAFVYNVYTEPAHRRRGLSRRLMETIHAWCRNAGITSIGLNTSAQARPLYESLGYRTSAAPMMFVSLD